MVPNRLARSSSPYLLQHKDNPVDWFEWGTEAFAMAHKAGLSTEVLYRTMITCTADSRQLRGLGKALVDGDYPEVTFHGLKDIGAAVDSGRAVEQAMPVTGLTRELYQLIDDKPGGLGGSNEVVRYYLEKSEPDD